MNYYYEMPYPLCEYRGMCLSVSTGRSGKTRVPRSMIYSSCLPPSSGISPYNRSKMYRFACNSASSRSCNHTFSSGALTSISTCVVRWGSLELLLNSLKLAGAFEPGMNVPSIWWMLVRLDNIQLHLWIIIYDTCVRFALKTFFTPILVTHQY